MTLVYIAGALSAPLPGLIQRNIAAAEAAGIEVAKLGAMPVVPHSMTANLASAQPEPFWLEGTRELLRRCDAIYVFNARHLQESAGTRGEVAEAQRLGLPVFHNFDELAAWLSGKAAA